MTVHCATWQCSSKEKDIKLWNIIEPEIWIQLLRVSTIITWWRALTLGGWSCGSGAPKRSGSLQKEGSSYEFKFCLDLRRDFNKRLAKRILRKNPCFRRDFCEANQLLPPWPALSQRSFYSIYTLLQVFTEGSRQIRPRKIVRGTKCLPRIVNTVVSFCTLSCKSGPTLHLEIFSFSPFNLQIVPFSWQLEQLFRF